MKSIQMALAAALISESAAFKIGYRPPTEAAPWHDPFVGSKVQEKEPYFVPHFGTDPDITNTQKHIT